MASTDTEFISECGGNNPCIIVPGDRPFLLTGTITINGETVQVEGSGYHDHNWGNAPMNALVGGWYWGRAKVEGMTQVAYTLSHRLKPASVYTLTRRSEKSLRFLLAIAFIATSRLP
jgi:hypothetical protein